MADSRVEDSDGSDDGLECLGVFPKSTVPAIVISLSSDDEVEHPRASSELQLVASTRNGSEETVIRCLGSLLNGKPIEEQVLEVVNHLVLPAEYLVPRVQIVKCLQGLLTEKFSKCRVYPYGADFIGIGIRGDAVNVFIDLAEKQGTSRPDSKILSLCKSNIDDLLAHIQNNEYRKFFGTINYNPPVISFIHDETGVTCNLRMNKYLLVQEAKVIRHLCSLDTRIIPLLVLARYWGSLHQLLDGPEEDTRNRILTLLVLFFLAMKKIVPTFAHLKNMRVKPEYFEGIDIAFCEDYLMVPRNECPGLKDKIVFCLSTLSLLREFFRVFAYADLKVNVVSLWNAEFIAKESFKPNNENALLSPELKKNYRYFANGNIRYKRLDCNTCLCVQDFQDLTENLTVSVAEYEVQRFQVECQRALVILESLMDRGYGNLMDLFQIARDDRMEQGRVAYGN